MGSEKGTINKVRSIFITLLLVFSSLVVSFITFLDINPVLGEPQSTPIGTITGGNDDRHFGWNVSSAGDINEDGYDDFIIGAPFSGGVIEAADWWNDNWNYRRRLTFDNSGQSEDMTNFPVLVNLSSMNFDYAKANLNASDLRFIDADGLTEFTYHVEKWNSTGNSYIWVNVTQIDGNSNSDFMWMYYNNSMATDIQDSGGTYDLNYTGVWHLNETGTGTRYDSTQYAIHGTPNDYEGDEATNGKISGADEFDDAGLGDWIDCGPDAVADTTFHTITLWANLDLTAGDANYQLVNGESTSPPYPGISLYVQRSDGAIGCWLDAGYIYSSVNTVTSGEWAFLAIKGYKDPISGYIEVSLNGGPWENIFSGDTSNMKINSGTSLVHGKWTGVGPSCATNGILDEIRISNVERSHDWISAQYLSMTDNFITYGDEEIINGTCGAAYIFLGGPGIMGDIAVENADIIINGTSVNNRFGWSVSAGNVVGDNTSDILVGGPGYEGNKGAVYIFDGDTLIVDGDGYLSASEATTVITGENPGDEFGRSIALTGQVTGSGWWNEEWGLRKKLTFDNSDQSETLLNFPVLVTLNTSNFDYSKTKMDGTDLRFIDVDGATELKYHIEEWNSSGPSYIWVNVTHIEGSSLSDYIWMYYNNPTAADFQDPGGTYDLNYTGVWHLNETGMGTRYDSTQYAIHGTPNDYEGDEATNGKISGADEFDDAGLGDWIDCGPDAVADTTFHTITLWANLDLTAGDANYQLVNGESTSSPYPGISLYVQRSNGAIGRWLDAGYIYSSVNMVTSGEWAFLAIKGYKDPISGYIDISLNGGLWENIFSGDTTNMAINPGTSLIHGKWTGIGPPSDTNGILDEIRISNVERSQDWISAQYLSMNNSFISFGTAENLEGGMYSIVVGAPGYGTSKGRAYIFFSDESIPINATDADVLLAGVCDNSSFGHSVSSAGDINGDGDCDIIVGAPGENKAFIYLGGSDMISTIFSKPLAKGAQDNTGGNMDDLKSDDDSYYTVPKNGGTIFIDKFNVSGLMGKIKAVTLFVQYHTGDNYGANENITWALDGQPLEDTEIEIIQSVTDVTSPGYDLFSQGVDTLDEIENIDISFINNEPIGGKKDVNFDYVLIEIVTNAAIPILILNGSSDFGWSVSGSGDLNGDGLGDVVIGAPGISANTPGQVNIKAGNLQSFDDESTGSTPDGWTQSSGNPVEINDSVFYGENGKSIKFNEYNTNLYKHVNPVPYGYVEFYARTSAIDNTNLVFEIGNSSAGAMGRAVAVYFGWGTAPTNVLRAVSGDGSGNYIGIDMQRYNADNWYHFRIAFDCTTDTYSVWIDGILRVNDVHFERDRTFENLDELTFFTDTGMSGHTGFIDEFAWLGSNLEEKITGEVAGDQFGYSVAISGNLNEDLYNDIIVGAPYANDNGTVYIFHGNDLWNPALSADEANIILEGESLNDGFGWSVSFAGDVNNNGQINFIVGAPNYDDGAITDAGKVYIFFGPIVTFQPDLWINGMADGFYSEIPAGGQIQTNIISAGDNSTWWIHLENDGNTNDTIDFSITVNMQPGWTWVLVQNGNGKIVNDGDFIHLTPGESRNYTLNISSPVSAGALDNSWVEIVAKTQNGTSHDSVKAVAIIASDLSPEITDVQVYPNPQASGGSVNITCNVTDELGVSEVWVNINLPGGGSINFTMGKGAGYQWFYNGTFGTVGLYQYTIWAKDSSSNWNSSTGHSFMVQDISFPVISNVIDIPDPQETGGHVNITCDVTDDIGVASVWLNITFPNEDSTNISMDKGATDQWFFNNSFADVGIYQYTIWVNDDTGNWNFSWGHSFTILDTTMPLISNVKDLPDPQETGGFVNITCNITDNIAVLNVWINLSLPGGGNTNISLIRGAGNQWFINSTYTAAGSYQYTIWTSDSSGNMNSSTGYGFEILISCPQLSEPKVSPITGNMNTWFNFTVTYSHTFDKPPGSITVNLTGPYAGTFDLIETNPYDNNFTDGKRYYYNISNLNIGKYAIHFAACSTGYCIESGVLEFEVLNRRPTLSIPSVDPVTGYPDIGFNFTVTYMDLDGHSPNSIKVNITGLDDYELFEVDPLDLDYTNGKTYYINITGIPLGTSYSFHFAAKDMLDEWGLETPEIQGPYVINRIAELTLHDKTAKYSEGVSLNATLIQNGTPIAGEMVGIYIDLNGNGIYELEEFVGQNQTQVDGEVIIYYRAFLIPQVYNYITVYMGTQYFVLNSTANLQIVPKPAVITIYDKVTEEGQSVTINASLKDEDGKCLPNQKIEIYVDRNRNSIFEGSEFIDTIDTNINGTIEITYQPILKPGTYLIGAKFKGSTNYSVNERSALLIIHNTTNNPPQILTSVPDQIKQEDSPPWILDLSPYEYDVEDNNENLKWYITDVNSSLYTIIGLNSTDDIITFIPVENAYGEDEVILWLEDSNGGRTSQKMWVNITSVNDRPKIESINPITVHFDSEYTYLFYNYISDIETPKEDLVLSTDDLDHTTVNGLKIFFLYPKSMLGEIVNVLVTVTDADGGATSTIVIVKISDDWVPELEKELPDVTLREGEAILEVFDLDYYFSDPDGDSLYYVTGQTHIKIDIDAISHVVNMTAPMDWFGSETVTFHAIDPSMARAEDIVLITVLPVNDVPIISGVPDLVVRFEQDYIFDLRPYISDEDNHDSDLILELTDSENGLTIPGVNLDQSNNLGMIINLPESMNGTTIQVRIWVSDGLDSNFTTINITVSDDYPPELVKPIPDITFMEDTKLVNAFNIKNFFIDIDDFYLVYTSGNEMVNVTINSDGSVDFSALENWYGFENVTFRATDDSGALVECTIKVFVIPLNDAPVIAQIPEQFGEQGKIWLIDISKYIFDIDNDLQDLIVSVDSEYVSVVGHTLIFEFPKSIENEIITITVSDGSLYNSSTFSVSISKVDSSSEGPLLWDYLIWLILIPIIITVLLLGLIAFKRKVESPIVEEVFLIGNDGILISHVSMNPEDIIDKDILSGMLTAVKNLISDAFTPEKENRENEALHKLEFGEKKILIEKSNYFFIAAVFKGEENQKLNSKIKKIINEIEETYNQTFRDWRGDMDNLKGADEIIESLLSLEKLPKEEREKIIVARKKYKMKREKLIEDFETDMMDLLSQINDENYREPPFDSN